MQQQRSSPQSQHTVAGWQQAAWLAAQCEQLQTTPAVVTQHHNLGSHSWRRAWNQ
jgi:hypothetical protein